MWDWECVCLNEHKKEQERVVGDVATNPWTSSKLFEANNKCH